MDRFIRTMRSEMARQDVTISQLARDLEMSRPYVHRVLSGQSTPTLDWADRVARYLGFAISIELDDDAVITG